MLSFLVKSIVRVRGRIAWLRLCRQARCFRRVQARTLSRIVASYAKTELGVSYGLTGGERVQAFRKKVPLHTYEDLREWIVRQMTEGGRVVVPDEPVVYYPTSGTTGEPKYIPGRKKTLRWNRQAQLLAGWRTLRERPKVFDGKIFAITGQAAEELTPRGIPIGSKSGQVYQNLHPLIKSKYVVPAVVFAIEDYGLKYLLMLRLALSCESITYFQTANTTTLVLLSDMLNEHWDRLIEDLRFGGFHRWEDLRSDVQKEVGPLLKPCVRRAEELSELQQQRSVWSGTDAARMRLREVFPDIQAVGCWTSGSCSMFLSRVRQEVPETALIRDLGYIASELHGTVPIDGNGRAAVPWFPHVFLEFIEKNRWERGEAKILGLEELVDGGQYYLVVSTEDGLLRYMMNDIVEVRGHFYEVPRLAFVQKGEGVTNITGEKLSEFQVVKAVGELEEQWDLRSTFFYMVADVRSCRYRLYYETRGECEHGYSDAETSRFAALLDSTLARLNMEYAAKRESGRLKAPHICFLKKNTLRELKQHWIAKGRSEGQFKLVALRYHHDVEFDFESCRVSNPRETKVRKLSVCS